MCFVVFFRSRRPSLPSRGGRIEILVGIELSEFRISPSPHGEGGLKYGQVLRHAFFVGPSPRGEGGLKLPQYTVCGTVARSLPTRGGWIEISITAVALLFAIVPPPTGRVD